MFTARYGLGLAVTDYMTKFIHKNVKYYKFCIFRDDGCRGSFRNCLCFNERERERMEELECATY